MKCYNPYVGPTGRRVRARVDKAHNPMQGHHICFTVFHWTGPDATAIPYVEPMQYLAYQHEKGGNTERDHLQGFVSFKKKLRLKAVQEILHDATAHLEPKSKYSTFEQAAGYCQKTDPTYVAGPWVFGTLPTGQGHRSDLDDAIEMVKAGKTNYEIAMACPKAVVTYASGLMNLRSWQLPMRDSKLQPEIIVHIGIPGAGKSWCAREQLEAKHIGPIYEYSPDMKGFFQRYAGQKAVLFDEIGGFQLNALKQLLHPGSICANIKNSDMPWLAECIHICSNHSPDDWYWRSMKDDPEASLPLWRVFAKVLVWHTVYDPSYTLPRYREFVREATDGNGEHLRDQVMDFWGNERIKRGLPRCETHSDK